MWHFEGDLKHTQFIIALFFTWFDVWMLYMVCITSATHTYTHGCDKWHGVKMNEIITERTNSASFVSVRVFFICHVHNIYMEAVVGSEIPESQAPSNNAYKYV